MEPIRIRPTVDSAMSRWSWTCVGYANGNAPLGRSSK